MPATAPPAVIAAPPPQLVGPDGAVAFGNFGGVPERLGLEHVDYRSLRRPPWNLTRWSARRLLKRWQFVGAVDEHLVLGAAVAHVHYLATGFAYVYDRQSGVFTERSVKAPLARGAWFSETPARGVTIFSRRGGVIEMGNAPLGGYRTLNVDLDGLEIRLRFREEGTGVSTASPQQDGGLHYTYKFAGLPAEGAVAVDGEARTLLPGALALLDWTASTPPRATTWNWSCGVGADAAGRRLGLNFSEGLVRGGFSQNTVWVEGVPTILPEMRFDYDAGRIAEQPWRLSTADRSVDLAFHPVAERFEAIDLKLVASRLHQPFGRFEGTFRVAGEELRAELFGFCEEHYAKW